MRQTVIKEQPTLPMPGLTSLSLRLTGLFLRNRLLWLVAGLILVSGVVFGLAYLGQDPKPELSVGRPIESSGTLRSQNNLYILMGDVRFPDGLVITNSEDPAISPLLKAAVNQRVQVYGAQVDEGLAQLSLAWINGRDVISNRGVTEVSAEAQSNKLLFSRLTPAQLTCFQEAISSNRYTELMKKSSTELAGEDLASIEKCVRQFPAEEAAGNNK